VLADTSWAVGTLGLVGERVKSMKDGCWGVHVWPQHSGQATEVAKEDAVVIRRRFISVNA